MLGLPLLAGLALVANTGHAGRRPHYHVVSLGTLRAASWCSHLP